MCQECVDRIRTLSEQDPRHESASRRIASGGLALQIMGKIALDTMHQLKDARAEIAALRSDAARQSVAVWPV